MTEPARHSQPSAPATDAPRLNPSRFPWITLAILLLPIGWLIYDIGPSLGKEKRWQQIRQAVFSSSSNEEAAFRLKKLGFNSYASGKHLKVGVNVRDSTTIRFLTFILAEMGRGYLIVKTPILRKLSGAEAYEFYRETTGTITMELSPRIHHSPFF